LEIFQDYGDKNLQWNQIVQDLESFSLFFVEFCSP
jgi:DNA polymerase III delta subunit